MVRLRDLGFTIGTGRTGPLNAITDVAGVSVGHATVIRDEPRVARTGVTIVTTRPHHELTDLCYGGIFSFNGNGEMTGSHWLDESGLVSGSIGITNTHQVGLVRDVLVADEVQRDPHAAWCLPIVGETYDGFLSDIDAFHLTADDVHTAIADADSGHTDSGHTDSGHTHSGHTHSGHTHSGHTHSGHTDSGHTDSGDAPRPVAEGNVGGGTGMICHGFKGGIGTSSRIVEVAGSTFTIGVLVQANYGDRELLRLDGHPVGRQIGADIVPLPTNPKVADAGSIIVIIATDAPLLADQCKRLARRATVGLARVGGTGGNGSGDIFLAFSTGNRVPLHATEPVPVMTLPADVMTPLFNATAEAVEESIWNALVAADTMTGHLGRTVHAIPHDLLTSLLD